jgi:DNA-binding transcriptional MerR regulator
MDKSPDAFRTISEVAEHLDTPAHVLRFWESRFPQIRPVKRAGGRRYYRPSDVALLTGIKRLLHDEGLTIRGVQKILRDQGVRRVAGLSDETVAIVDLGIADVAAVVADDRDGTETPEGDAIEAGVPEAEEDVVPSPPPPRQPLARPTKVQPPLPLFEAAAPIAPRPRREDVTIAALLRGLPRGALAGSRVDVTNLARKLAALRTTLAERADGGRG